MRRFATLSLLAVLSVAVCPAGAAELVLGQAEMRNLGIEFTQLRSVKTVADVSARAYVVIPPASEYVISSSLAGLVARVRAEAGEFVSAGQPLLEIRSSGFLTAQQEFLEALHLAALAAAQLARDEQLAEEGIIAARRLEETRASAAAASGRRAEHAQMLLIAGMRNSDLQELENTGTLQDILVIRAPIDGVILERTAKAGESIDSLVSLYRMADLTELWLDIRVPQESMGRIEPGMTVLVLESAVDGPARVMSIGQAIDTNTQTVSVRARLTESGHGLKPGQLVSANIMASHSTSAAEPLWSVPAAALIRSGEKSYVFTRATNGVDAREVTPVGNTAGEVQVLGIAGDAEVVVSGVSALKALWLGSADPDS